MCICQLNRQLGVAKSALCGLFMVPHLLASFTCVIGLHFALLAEVLLASNTSHSILAKMDGGFMSEFFAVVIFLVDVEIALFDLNHSSAWANRHVWVIPD